MGSSESSNSLIILGKKVGVVGFSQYANEKSKFLLLEPT